MPLIIRVIPIKAELFNVQKVMNNIEAVLLDTGKTMRTEFQKTTESWGGEKPTMGMEVEMGDKDAGVWSGPVGTESEVNKWKRLDEGTPAHDIFPRRYPYLQFPWQGKGKSYVAATSPRWFGSRKRQKLGRMTHFYHVWHPGSEPREWSLAMAAQQHGLFAKHIQEAIDKGLE